MQNARCFENGIKWITLFVILIFLLPNFVFSQDSLLIPADEINGQNDLPQLIREARHKEPKVKPDGAGSLLLLPIVASNPATGFMLDIGGQYALKLPGSSL